MESEKPVRPADVPKPVSRWSVRRVCAVLSLLFAVIFVASWWLTPVEPYATLNIDDEFGSCVFSPDSTMLVMSGNKDIWCSGPLRVWDVERGEERFSIAYDREAIGTVLFSPDGTLLAVDAINNNFKLWNTTTGEEAASIGIGTRSVKWVEFQFSPDGRFLVFQPYIEGPEEDHIKFWNVESKQEQRSVESYLATLAFAPDGKSFATSRFARRNGVGVVEVLLWKMNQVPVLEMQHQTTSSGVAFSPDLRTFATADVLRPDGNGQVAMWDMMTGEKRWSVIVSVIVNGDGLHYISFIANGKILAAHDVNGRTRLWDVSSTPKAIGSFSERPAISPDGQWVAIPFDSGAKLIKVSAPNREADLIVNGDFRSKMGGMGMRTGLPTPSFSTDSKMLLVTGLGRSGRKPFLGDWLPEKYNPFRGVPDGGVVRIWDTETRREVFSIDDCYKAWFSPDGKVLATRPDPKAIDLWKVPFRASLWRILGWAVIAWLVALAIGWLGVKARRMLL
jgi:WD40 repeat protein